MHGIMQDELEQKTLSLGKQLLDTAEEIRKKSGVLTRSYWEEKILDFIMRREGLKVQSLRYIDVYPMLHTLREKVLHFAEYLEAPEARGDKLARLLAVLFGRTPPPFRSLLGVSLNLGISLFARKFIAGQNPHEAFTLIQNLGKKEMSCSLNILGEIVHSEKEAEEYTGEYTELLEELHKLSKEQTNGQLDINISVKPSSFYSQFNPAAPEHTAQKVIERLRRLLRTAISMNAFVNMDVEHYEYRDATLRLFELIALDQEFRDYPRLGFVVQAYVHDSDEFLGKLLPIARERPAPFQVRLVKGAYWDYEIIVAGLKNWKPPVFQEKWQTDARFEQITRALIDQHPKIKTAIASHNIRSIAFAMACAAQRGLSPAEVEFQLLYGMGEDIKQAIATMGYPMRVYAPYGELIPGMAYLVRRILENTSNESFLRQRSTGAGSVEALLNNPLSKARDENERGRFQHVLH